MAGAGAFPGGRQHLRVSMAALRWRETPLRCDCRQASRSGIFASVSLSSPRTARISQRDVMFGSSQVDGPYLAERFIFDLPIRSVVHTMFNNSVGARKGALLSVISFLGQGSRAAIVDVAARLDSREVRRAFTDEGFAFRPQALRIKSDAPTRTGRFFDKLVTMSAASSSRILAECYLDEVDWSSAAQTLAALGAIEELLWLFERAVVSEEILDSRPGERLRYKLRKEGFRFDRHGRIHPASKLLTHDALAGLSDPDLIRQVLRRITGALPDDPMLAIGSAKELVEGTSKAILARLGKPVPNNANLPELVRLAEEALGNHPKSVSGMPDGAPAIRRLLGKLTGMTDDLAALRNDYGTGHAPTTFPQGLQPRHGRLAVAAADAWCTFMLDTLAEQTARRHRRPGHFRE